MPPWYGVGGCGGTKAPPYIGAEKGEQTSCSPFYYIVSPLAVTLFAEIAGVKEKFSTPAVFRAVTVM